MDEQQDDASASNTAFQGSDSRRSAGSGSTALSDHGAPLPEDDLNGDEQAAPEGFLNTLLWIQDPSLSLRLSNPLAEAQHTLHERRAAEAMVQHTAMILDVDGLRHHVPTSTELPMNYEFPATVVIDFDDEEYDQATADLVNGRGDGTMRDWDADDYDDIPIHDDADAKSFNAREAEEDDVLYEERPQ